MSPEPPAEEGEERCLECGESAGSTSLIARLRAENEELRKHDTECCQQEGSYHLMIEKERDAARAKLEETQKALRGMVAILDEVRQFDESRHHRQDCDRHYDNVGNVTAEARRVLGEVGK